VTDAGPPRQLTGSALARTRAVVDEVLTRAARDGERVVSYARLALGSVILVGWPLATWDELMAGVRSSYAVIGLAAAAVLFSLAVLLRLRRVAMTQRMRTVSILVDSALVLGLLAAFVADPPPTYHGVGRITGIGAAYFAVLAAGIRLSRRGAILAVMIIFMGVGALLGIDELVNDIDDTLANWVTIAAMILTAGVFSWLIADRTKRLVLEGVEQTLLAERARARLGAYVSEEVAAASLASDTLRLGGARQQVAVLFSDLRNFTTASEKADPEELVRELNEYFEFMVAAVSAEGGVVDKYIGDSIMAVFGAPTPRLDDAARAVRAAWGMEQALLRLNDLRGKRGLRPLQHGIGVHLGTAVAGNIGTTARAQYTVIGDTVNVAARLESATKEQGATVLLSQAVVDALAASPPEGVPPLRLVGDVKAKGRAEAIRVHAFDVPA
jgi:class 3 adenylate cyclase